MNTELLINGNFEKGNASEEKVLNPRNGDLIISIPKLLKIRLIKQLNLLQKLLQNGLEQLLVNVLHCY